MLTGTAKVETGDATENRCDPAAARFDALEMRVLRLVAAGNEHAPRGRFGAAVDAVLGRRGGGPLADRRLEALRRAAAAAFRGGREAAGEFLAAGYSACQLDAVRAMMTAARPEPVAAGGRYGGGVAIGLSAIASVAALTATILTH